MQTDYAQIQVDAQIPELVAMQGLATLTTNPVLTDVLGGLAASATAFAAVERMLLWDMRNMTVEPFGETVQQVFARISALRDSLDGPQVSMQQTTAVLCCAVRCGAAGLLV